MLNQDPYSTRHSAGSCSPACSLMAAVCPWFMGTAFFLSQMISWTAWSDEPPTAQEKALTAEEQKALAEFQKLYRLEKDQTVKYIKPPFVAGRLIDREHRWKDKWMNADYQKGTAVRAGLIPYCYIYFERSGELAAPHHFSSGSDQIDPADRAIDVTGVIEMVTNVRETNLIGADKFSKVHIAGDWVIREGAPTEQVVAGLEQTLNKECGIPIKLEYQEVKEDVVIVRHGAKPFAPKLDSAVKIYTTVFRSDQGTKEQGTFKEFLDAIGQSIEPNMRVISELENPFKGAMSWHVGLPDRFDDGDLGLVLEHLDEQTGLKFKAETLTIGKITVTRNE